MVADWEYSYNGLTFGGAQPLGIITVDGLTSMPNAREDINDKVGRHGAFTYTDRYEYRRVTIDGDVTHPTQATFEGYLNSLKLACALRSDNQPLVFKRPGLPVTQMRLYCKPVRVATPLDTQFSIGYGLWSAQFIAEDPFLYNDTLQTAAITPGAGTVGVTSSGIVPTLFENVRVTGPWTGSTTVRLNADTTNSLKYNGAITAGHYIDIDFQDRTIVDDLGVSQYANLDPASKWWNLPLGASTLQTLYGGGTTAATRADFQWRDAWL